MPTKSLEPQLPLKPSNSQVSQSALESLCRQLLLGIGENPDREGLQDTPRRWAKWWKEFIEYDAGTITTTFNSQQTDELVVISGIRVYSLCEHHLLPFWTDLSIGYLINEKIIGLSKIARIAHACAHKLQVQEHLCDEIALQLGAVVKTENVAVLGAGVHTCMTMRGIKTDAVMKTSVLRGMFKTNAATRQEFFSLAQ